MSQRCTTVYNGWGKAHTRFLHGLMTEKTMNLLYFAQLHLGLYVKFAILVRVNYLQWAPGIGDCTHLQTLQAVPHEALEIDP